MATKSSSLPKYVRSDKGDALYYIRFVPTRLRPLTTERKIQIPLDCTESSSTKSILEATSQISWLLSGSGDSLRESSSVRCASAMGPPLA